MDDQEQVLLELSFPEITAVSSQKTNKVFTQTFSLSTVRNEEFTFQSPNAEDIRDLVVFFLEGLKKRLASILKFRVESFSYNCFFFRSKFLIALQEYQAPTESSNFLSFLKGDLIILEDDSTGESVINSRWCIGRCERTQERGDFPAETVYVLPTLSKPPNDIVALFNTDEAESGKKLNASSTLSVNDLSERPHTLFDYALDHFRVPPKRTMSKALSLRTSRGHDELWRHTREPLKQPLLKKLVAKEELANEACFAFSSIMKYMGDLPSKRSRIGSEITDHIFDAPLKHEILRDEIYCQIIRQLTDNKFSNFMEKFASRFYPPIFIHYRNRLSEERGWELMWLATGLFACSQGLLKELMLFLRSRRHPISQDSIHRLQKTLRNGQR